jgi:hypothetical protein
MYTGTNEIPALKILLRRCAQYFFEIEITKNATRPKTTVQIQPRLTGNVNAYWVDL